MIQLSKNKKVSDYCEPYIIAEIGANHNGDMSLAKKMIDSAKKCGADAAKFQSWTSKSLISQEEYDRNQSYDDSPKKHFGTLYEMVKKYALTPDQHIELKEYCDSLDIDFCSTPFSKEEVDMLEDLNVIYHKVASMDINNITLLKYIAKTKKPILLSTGMASIEEIEKAVKIIEAEGNNKIIILHCVSLYPPKYKDMNLNNIIMLREKFKHPIGFSDHTFGYAIPLAAVSLGACVIEKHFTIDKTLPGWDHEISADEAELEIIVRESKNIVLSMGKFERVVSKADEEKRKKFRRSLVVTRDMKAGDIIKLDDIAAKRPGTGISPDQIDRIIGKKIKRDFSFDELLHEEDLL